MGANIPPNLFNQPANLNVNPPKPKPVDKENKPVDAVAHQALKPNVGGNVPVGDRVTNLKKKFEALAKGTQQPQHKPKPDKPKPAQKLPIKPALQQPPQDKAPAQTHQADHKHAQADNKHAPQKQIDPSTVLKMKLLDTVLQDIESFYTTIIKQILDNLDEQRDDLSQLKKCVMKLLPAYRQCVVKLRPACEQAEKLTLTKGQIVAVKKHNLYGSILDGFEKLSPRQQDNQLECLRYMVVLERSADKNISSVEALVLFKYIITISKELERLGQQDFSKTLKNMPVTKITAAMENLGNRLNNEKPKI